MLLLLRRALFVGVMLVKKNVPLKRFLVYLGGKLFPEQMAYLRSQFNRPSAQEYTNQLKNIYANKGAGAQSMELSKLDNQAITFLYVDHTSGFSKNTGIQQVCRNLFVSMIEQNRNVIPVKWNFSKNTFDLLNEADFETLLMYTRELSSTSYEFINFLLTMSALPKSSHNTGVIVVPEVTHINANQRNITNNLIREAKQLGLKTAFIFYDDIPLRRNELQSIKRLHTDYMKELAEADFVFPISNYSKKSLRRFWSGNNLNKNLPSKIETIHLANSMETSKSTKTKFPFNEPFLLSGGSITEHKNQEALIKAFQTLEANTADGVTLYLIGTVAESIKEKISNLIATNKNIEIITEASNEILIEGYRRCLFSIFPSVDEGFGLPIIESLAFGKPCITANFGAMREIGNKYKGCLLVDTKDPNEISAAIERLIKQPNFYKRLKEEALSSNIKDWRTYTNELLDYCHVSQHEARCQRKQKRIFWLGMHKILVKTELPRLRDLGFEVFNPPYLSDIEDQSANQNWDSVQATTLPEDVFRKLSETNFFYVNQLDAETAQHLNDHFGTVIVTISPTWLAPFLRQFKGKIIYRTYGQSFSLTEEFSRLGIADNAQKPKSFIFYLTLRKPSTKKPIG